MLDGLMLAHWKQNGTVDVLVPDIKHHRKDLVLDGRSLNLEDGTYNLEVIPSPSGMGPAVSSQMRRRHFCMKHGPVTRSANEPETKLVGLPRPVATYGKKRFITLAKNILNGESPTIIEPCELLEAAFFCEAIVLEYNADAIRISHPKLPATDVREFLVVRAVVPPEHNQPGPHGQKFNNLLNISGHTPNLRVTDLKAHEILRWDDDPIPGIPDSNFVLASSSGMDCAVNFLVEN